jgi:hypothetical protein
MRRRNKEATLHVRLAQTVGLSRESGGGNPITNDRIEIFMTVKIQGEVFRVVTPCSVSFGEGICVIIRVK